jgi:superfamily I DNA/RNA helicase
MITSPLDYGMMEPFLEFESDVTEKEIEDACEAIEYSELQMVYLDVFLALQEGNVDSAQDRILLYQESLKLLENSTIEEQEAIVSNDQYVKLDELEAEYLKGILDTKDWYDWMLFLHPRQREAVNKDHQGAARLLGVSGSGKTCVLVHRAVRLAKLYPEKPILILTLNPALSQLIKELIGVLLGSSESTKLAVNIKVSSFWELCRDLLIEFDQQPLTKRVLSSKTDKLNETIDEVWDEYYRCENNNDDAKILMPLHQTLLVRKIFPQDYIRQEFDWIRSAFPTNVRKDYLKAERDGRKIPIIEDDRTKVLGGLKSWEDKMSAVGAIDYLGLANRLCQYEVNLKPQYRCILVDEVQDFGTIELSLIRKLVVPAENDLYLVGDIAQQVYNKQHKLKGAGINIPKGSYDKILKNYRNSREILTASYGMFQKNIIESDFNSDEFEVLQPEYANFSSPKPFLRKGESLEEELLSTLTYLKGLTDEESKEKACIAICGLSIFQVAELASQVGLPSLDGANSLEGGSIFLSDLEQTKGFEFDRVVIVNCNRDVFPSPSLPKEEWYREISKLYVAMTRSKKELVVSYSTTLSTVFDGQSLNFREDNWKEHLWKKPTVQIDLSKVQVEKGRKNRLEGLNGEDFLYTKMAMGISKDLQERLAELVNGSVTYGSKGAKESWLDMADLAGYLEGRYDRPAIARLFKPKAFEELEALIAHIKLLNSPK